MHRDAPYALPSCGLPEQRDQQSYEEISERSIGKMRTRKPIRLLQIITLVAVLPSVVSCNTLRLVNPSPIRAAGSMEQTRKVILQSLGAKSWGITSHEPGKILATLHARKHMAEVEITYDSEEIRIRYVDSEKLEYRKSWFSEKEYIHGKYNAWVQDLAAAISVYAAYE